MALALSLALLAAIVMSAVTLYRWLTAPAAPPALYATQCSRCGRLTTEFQQDNCAETTHPICTDCQ